MTESESDQGRNLLIVQDRLTTPGGGERVIYYLSNRFNCDIVTGEFRPESTYNFDKSRVTELGGNSFFEFIKARAQLDWDRYEAVIFSGNRPQFSLWKSLDIPTIRYCHSPTRTFWSLRDKAYREAPPIGKLTRHATAPVFRTIDRKLASRHNKILTNSHNIRNQVDRFYGLDADVLYPPIDTTLYRYEDHDDYWLSVNRLVPKKRVLKQIKAFENTSEQLRIIGGVDDQFEEYGQRVIDLASSIENVSIEGHVPDTDLRNLYAKCKGVVYLPYFEDFGIVPLEAMASGKPVVAAAEGGPIETISDGNTGWLIKPTPEQLQAVITHQFNPEDYRQVCQDYAGKYDVDRFSSEFRSYLAKLID